LLPFDIYARVSEQLCFRLAFCISLPRQIASSRYESVLVEFASAGERISPQEAQMRADATARERDRFCEPSADFSGARASRRLLIVLRVAIVVIIREQVRD